MSYFTARWAVAVAYRAEHPSATSVDEQTLLAYDGTLRAEFESAMHDAAATANIPLTPENVALLMLLAATGPAGSEPTQMTKACAYFNSVKPQIGSTTAATVVYAPPSTGS